MHIYKALFFKERATQILGIILAQLEHSEYQKKKINAQIAKLVDLDTEINEFSETFSLPHGMRFFVSLKPNRATLETQENGAQWCSLCLETEIGLAGKTLGHDEISSYIVTLSRIKSVIIMLEGIDYEKYKVCVKTAEEAAAENAARLIAQQRACLIQIFHKKYAGIKPGYMKTVKHTATELAVFAPLHTIKNDEWTQGAYKYTVDQAGENVYITCIREK
jgi:hypothetical protein